MLQIEHPFLQVFLLKQKSIISTSESRESIREFVTKNTDTDMAMTTSDIDTHIDGQCVSVSDVGSRTCFHMVVDRSTSCFHTDGHVMSTSSTSCIHVVNISYPHAHIMASVSSSVTWVDAVVVDVGLFGVSSCSPRSFDDLISWSCWKYVEKMQKMHRSPRTCHISYVAMAVSISDPGEMHSDFGDTARSFLSTHQSKCHECHERRLSASATTATLCRAESIRCVTIGH